MKARKEIAMRLFSPGRLLQLEGVVVLLLALFGFWMTQGNWWQFALLLLAPDLSMIGYLAGPRVGSITYNVFHNYFFPASLLALSVPAFGLPLWHIGLIWFAHIGMDRMLGYGLKYPTAFKDTHLQRV
jgi:hypothetical protein